VVGGSERAHFAPTRGGEACSACRYGAGTSLRTVVRPVRALGVRAQCAGVTRSAHWLLQYDGGNSGPNHRHRVPSCTPLGRVRRVFVETAFRAGDVLGDAAALRSSRLRTAHLGSRVDRKPDCRCPSALPPLAAVQRGRPCWRAGYGSRHLRRAMPKVTTSLSAFDTAHHRKLLGT
jgi:hypothetical protein